MRTQINQTSGFISALEKALPVIIFLLGISYFCFRILGLKLEYIPGDLGDSRFINFLFEHGHQWISGKQASFWDAPFMYPFKNSIALSDNMLGTLPLYSVWRYLGFEIETSYQLWWLCICTLNYWICYIILRKWKQSTFSAAILAWIFAFSIFNIGQLNNMQMIIRFAVPVAFYAAAKLLAAPSPKYMALYLIAILMQMYSVMYTGIYLMYFTLFFIIVNGFLNKNFKNLLFYLKRGQLLYSAINTIAFAILMFILIYPYQQMTATVGLRLFKEVTPNLPEACSFLFPHESSITWHFLFKKMRPEAGEFWLHYLFPGIILFLTLIAAPAYLTYSYFSKKNNDRDLQVFIICSTIIALLHLHIGDRITLYALIFKLPGINSIRVPIRFMHVELFLLIFILGHFIRKFNTVILSVLFILIIGDNLFDPALVPRVTKKEIISRRESLTKKIQSFPVDNTSIIAVVDTLQPAFITHMDAMCASQSIGLKTINGYSSYCDDNFGEFFTKCNMSGLNNWINYSKLERKNIYIINRNK